MVAEERDPEIGLPFENACNRLLQRPEKRGYSPPGDTAAADGAS
jgi:hypothetical protein